MEKVIVGLSGGVDSAVAALLLKQAGYEVEAIFMRNWDSSLNNDYLGNPTVDDDVCPQEKDYQDAIRVAELLNIKLHRIDFVKEYWDDVFGYFISEYKKGRTPNPDIMCNKYIKFNCFLKEAIKLGADYIAMGHYAIKKEENGHAYLYKGKDTNKDQSYFLCELTEEQVKKSMFPLGYLTKPEVRKIALEFGFNVAQKKDSTGICFIGERNFKQFLKNYLPAKEGNIVTIDGDIMGKHDGLMYYTIGQRKGLGIGGNEKYPLEPWFVIGKNLEKNELIIGQGFNNPLLLSNKAIIEDFNWINSQPSEKNFKCSAKFRYRQSDIKVEVTLGDEMIVTYDNVRAVTPGQACVLYDGEKMLGGGIIKEVYKDSIKLNY